jgi:hypothetical protein
VLSLALTVWNIFKITFALSFIFILVKWDSLRLDAERAPPTPAPVPVVVVEKVAPPVPVPKHNYGWQK